jgi:glucosyl-dolichyl phosphate glucuronosyltransferase
MTGISIIIATYNRCDELSRTLGSLAAIEFPASVKCEVLVIDNRCTDNTQRFATEWAAKFPVPLRVVAENRQGLSHARNRGIDAARYDVIAYLDDDVDVDRNWLKAMAAAHAEDQYAAIGGRASLVYPAGRPDWLGDADDGLLSKVELGDERKLVGPDDIYGVNLSFRRRDLIDAGGFRTDLGRVGTNLIGSEEFEILSRIAAGGGQLLYEPAATVGHRVPMSRLSRRWFWRRCYHGLRGSVRALPEEEVNPSELARSGVRTLRAARKALGHLRHPRSQEFFHETVVVASGMGRCVGMLSRLLGRTGGPEDALFPAALQADNAAASSPAAS